MKELDPAYYSLNMTESIVILAHQKGVFVQPSIIQGIQTKNIMRER